MRVMRGERFSIIATFIVGFDGSLRRGVRGRDVSGESSTLASIASKRENE